MRLSATRQASIAQSRGFGNLLWDLAGMPPLLDLRLAENKSLVNVVSGVNLATATRGSSGTFVGSDRLIQSAGVDVPRFTHDPVTGRSLGLLSEGQRVNLLQRSQEFDDAYWSKANASITANATTAPDGTSTADLITENTATAQHNVSQAVTTTGQKTFSVFAKQGPGTRLLRLVDFNPTDGAQSETYFNLSTGAVVSGTGTIRAFPNGWYRCSITTTTTVTSTYFISISSGNGVFSYTGDNTSGLFLWGAQLEEGSSATSYTPTTNATVTRSADVIDLINQAIANNIRTLYLEFRSPAVGTRGVVSLNDNTANERASVITSGTDPRLVVVDGGVEQANINGGTVVANARTRVAVRITTNSFAISINGGPVITDSSGSLPSVDRIMLGRTQAGEHLNAPLARVIGWPNLVPDSLLQALSQ